MRFLVQSGGTLGPDRHEPADRDRLQGLFDRLAEALARINDFEADVAVDFATGEVDFFIVVEGSSPKDAIERADGVVVEAMKAAGVGEPVDWDELRARRADLVPA